MDFSQVIGDNIPDSFTEVVNASVSKFSEKYYEGGFLKRPVTINEKNFASSISNMTSAVELSGHKLSLIVDEVDSFANRLLLQVSREKDLDTSGYNQFVKKEGSVLRDFGRVVKSASNTCIERMFFTGVMPVAWSDAFSSLNTVEDLTHTDAFQVQRHRGVAGAAVPCDGPRRARQTLGVDPMQMQWIPSLVLPSGRVIQFPGSVVLPEATAGQGQPHGSPHGPQHRAAGT